MMERLLELPNQPGRKRKVQEEVSATTTTTSIPETAITNAETTTTETTTTAFGIFARDFPLWLAFDQFGSRLTVSISRFLQFFT